MKSFALIFSALLTLASTAGSALAKVPYFAAKCPTDIYVETDRAGRAYISGKKASVRSMNANYHELRGSGVTVSVAVDPGALTVTYTGKNRANGVCQVVEQETVESAAPETVKPETAKPYNEVPARDKRACLKAVKKTTHNPKAVVIGAESSEANNSVTIGVGPQRAPWRCLVKRGVVADVMSLTDEGNL